MSKVIQLRRKLASIGQINKMTEAMQVVAVAQLKKVQMRQKAAWHYRLEYERLAGRLGSQAAPAAEKVRPVQLIYLLASERGFCGSFNESLVNKAREYSGAEFIVIGNKGCEAAREAGLGNVRSQIKTEWGMNFEAIAGKAMEAYDLYRSGQVREIHLLFNEFRSMLFQAPRLAQALPFDFTEAMNLSDSYIFEPALEEIRQTVELNYLKALFYDAFMQTRLGEVAARLMTMRGAADNSAEMMDELKIKLNKARQAMITGELSEILSSFEILAEEE
ncbi:MAG: F0F1 ATP synthase subunit gamma [Candidatus Margulisbacteria bacterium]|nr:F0F1 ATP synthase subunit gamma [Candidatus Margulisiibacteriota bacterium]